MAEAPDKLFVQLTAMGGTISYISKPPDNRRPVYEYVRADLSRAAADDDVWQPIETAPQNEEWRVVGKVSDGKLLWWYRAMYWRGGWYTSRSYDKRIAPSHHLPLPQPGSAWAKSRAEREGERT